MSKKRNKRPSKRQISPVLNRGQLSVQTAEFYSGPLPRPRDLQQYNDVLPGAAERILGMAEKQADHRQTIESRVIGSDVWRAKAGLIFGFLICLAGIVGGFVLIYTDKVWTGSIFGFGSLAALVGSFIYGTQKRYREIEQRRQKESRR